jgi:PAS domain S-box-containing protein
MPRESREAQPSDLFGPRTAGDDELLRLFIESTVDYAFITLDPTGHVTSWNQGAERLKGYQADEILGQHFSVFYPGDVPREIIDARLAVAASEGHHREEGWRVRKDGTSFWADVVITVIRDHDGKLRGFGKVTRDLTERKEADDEIRDASDKMRDAQAQLVAKERLSAIGELAAVVSHELRNPLASLSNTLFVMRQDVERHDESSLAEQLDVAERQVERAVRIVSDVLDFARSGEPNKRPVSLDDLFDEILLTSSPPDSVEVIRSTEPDLTAMVDPDQLRRVLINLVTNAYQAMPEGGTMQIETSFIGGDARIVLTDSGVGISEAAREKIFHPFFTTRSHGTGLGLAVVQRIVEAHGGSIAVESAPGAGTTFAILLPGASVSS